MATPKKLVLLDMHAILHRAYHALPDFSSSKGEPTGALYGLISMLVKIITDLKPDYVVAAYDLPKPTYRHLVYEGYKAGRPKTEDALVSQLIRSRDVLAALGVPWYEKEEFEADDVIGTIVEKLKKDKTVSVIIASGDMDTMQLVEGTHVQVFTPRKGLSETVLYDEDAVVARYGFKPEFVPDYKGLRGDPSDNIPGVKGIGDKTATALIAEHGTLERVYELLKKDPEMLKVKPGILEKLREGEHMARLSKELAQIHTDVPIAFSLPAKTWKEAADVTRVLDMLAEFDFRSLIPRVRELFGAPPMEQEEEETGIPKEAFEKAALAVWVLDSSVTTPNLEDIYRAGKSKVFATALEHLEEQIKENHLEVVYQQIELPLIPILEEMHERGIKIDRAFLKTLSEQYHKELDTIAERIYVAAGKTFNINSPKQLGEILFDTLGLSVKNQKKTSSGARSTRESELEKLRELHPIVPDILAYRELQKLLSTYIDNIPTLLDAHDRLHTSFIQTGTTTGRLASQNPNLQNIPIKTELGRAIRYAFIADTGMHLVSFDYSQIELRIAAFLSGDEGLTDIFVHGRDVHAEVAAKVFGVDPSAVTYEQRRRAKIINFGILYGMGVTSLREALGTSRIEAQEFYNEYFAAFPQLAAYIEDVKAHAAKYGYTTTYFGRRRYFEGIHSAIPYIRASAERMAINAPLQGTQADIIKLAMVRIAAWLQEHELDTQVHLLLQVHDELVYEVPDDQVDRCAKAIKEIMEEVLPAAERRNIPFLAEGKKGKNWGDMHKL